MNKLKYKAPDESPYERLGLVDIASVLNAVPSPPITPENQYAIFLGERIEMTSLRYLTFKVRGTICSHCGLNATHFAVERDRRMPNPKNAIAHRRYHLNLYAVLPDGKEMLFTKDHVFPKSKGGKDHIDNMQTLCAKCNYEKGSTV